MAYQQVRIPKVMIPVEGGWCLKFVDDTVDANLRQKTAMAAYNVEKNNGNVHAERPPVGLYVPVFFSLSNNSAGHVALTLPDGRVASATRAGKQAAPYIHPNIDDLIRVYSSGRVCKYLGWSTYCDGRQFVKWVNDPVPSPAPSKVTVYGKTKPPATVTSGDMVAKIAQFMRATFPAYTSAQALGPIYGPNLEAAIKEFQRRTGLTADGFVGPITLARLRQYGFKG